MFGQEPYKCVTQISDSAKNKASSRLQTLVLTEWGLPMGLMI